VDGAALSQGGPRPTDFEMKPPYAHVSRTLLVVAAAAGAVWLSAFFLPAAGVQPVPVLPMIGSVAGKVVAVSEPHRKPKVKPVAARRHTIAAVVARAPFAPPVSSAHAVQPRSTASVVVHKHKRHRAHAPRHGAKSKRFAPVQAAAPAAAPAVATPVAHTRAPRGRAVGWHRKHEESTSGAAVEPTHRHGRSHGGHDAPPAQPATTTAPTPAVPAAPSSPGAGHDHGKHRGDDHDHGDHGQGDHGHGPGGKK
jgi:hypothetical protein